MSTAAELTEVTLRRETILLSPVYSAVIHHVAPSGQETKTGYVRLSAFSQVCISSVTTRLHARIGSVLKATQIPRASLGSKNVLGCHRCVKYCHLWILFRMLQSTWKKQYQNWKSPGWIPTSLTYATILYVFDYRLPPSRGSHSSLKRNLS